MMAEYRVLPVKGFGGGLNLQDGVDVVEDDQAIDALNVMFTTRGTVGERSGYAQFTAAEGTNRYDSLTPFYKSDGTKQLVAGASTRLEALNTAGAVLDSSIAPTASPHYFQRFGGPAGEYVFIANGTDTLRQWDGSAFSTPSYTGTTPDGKFLALSVTDNRLVNAHFDGTTAGNNPSTVRFSDEGDPLTWGNTNYEDLTPGDGEEIMGAAAWRDLVFVFKQSKFFVFYGQTVDDDGAPVFNYRPVDAGVGLVSSRALAVAEQGIYFLDRTGIYFTSGSQPERVSDAVRPIFHGGSSVYYTGGELNASSVDEATMVYHDERLWLSFPSGTSSSNDRNLVFDPHEKWWTLFDIPAGPMTVFRPSAVEELVFGYASGTKHIGRYVEGSYTADDTDTGGAGGNAIEAYWQSGWFDYDLRAVKTIRESKIVGSGLVTVQFYRDYRQTPALTVQRELSAPVGLWDSGLMWGDGTLWGPSGIIAPKAIRRAVRGASFSLRFSNNTLDRTFRVHRFEAHVREVRVPSVIKVA